MTAYGFCRDDGGDMGSTWRDKGPAAIRLRHGLDYVRMSKITTANDNVDMRAVRLAA
jgi:hypothetical protein